VALQPRAADLAEFPPRQELVVCLPTEKAHLRSSADLNPLGEIQEVCIARN